MNKFVDLKDLVPKMLIPVWKDDVLHHDYVLVCLGEVRKSGARIYFRPANNDFTADGGKTYFDTYKAAYKSQDW